jgi:hypothetical protein
MWLNRSFLGARFTSIMVSLAVPQLWIPWTSNSGGWTNGRENFGKMEKAESPSKTLEKGFGRCFSAILFA